MRFIATVPMLIIPMAIYHVFIYADINMQAALVVPLYSGAIWRIMPGDILVMAGFILMYIEIIKSTRTSQASIVDHVLSLILFIGALVEFLMWPEAGTSTFFFLLLMSLVDVVGGFTITITGARRDFGRIGFAPITTAD